MKNILVGKCFGIGNAVMAIPMIRALQSLPDTRVDILIGDTSDDVGARQVLSKVVSGTGKLYVTSALEHLYDVAVMAIPFDGRWVNGVHFEANRVLDGRTRPDPSTTGLDSWKIHEIDYQMENAFALGYDPRNFPPSTKFLNSVDGNPNKIYVGLGYKKDVAEFWKVKHWGNENYAALIKKLLDSNPKIRVVTTGDIGDLQHTIGPISRLVNDKRFEFRCTSNLDESFYSLSTCGSYVGNDTGMMHVAASCNLRVLGLFFMKNAWVKNRPWCGNAICLDASHGEDLSVDSVFNHVVQMVNSCTS